MKNITSNIPGKKSSMKKQTKKITEEELENIHPDLDHNFPSTTADSGLMTVFHNDLEKFIDDPGDFPQYRI